MYILQCADETYYTGYTNDLQKRIALHNGGKGAKYTKARRPVKLVWVKEYKYFKRAVLMEYRIKTLARRQKQLLIEGRRLQRLMGSGLALRNAEHFQD